MKHHETTMKPSLALPLKFRAQVLAEAMPV